MNVPNHIAIILDGNGRWAKAKGMPRSYGHMKGCANLETVCDYMKELGVKYVTVYAFSTENWKRSKEEVDGLMKLFRSYAHPGPGLDVLRQNFAGILADGIAACGLVQIFRAGCAGDRHVVDAELPAELLDIRLLVKGAHLVKCDLHILPSLLQMKM